MAAIALPPVFALEAGAVESAAATAGGLTAFVGSCALGVVAFDASAVAMGEVRVGLEAAGACGTPPLAAFSETAEGEVVWETPDGTTAVLGAAGADSLTEPPDDLPPESTTGDVRTFLDGGG